MPVLPTLKSFFSQIQRRSQRRSQHYSVPSAEVLEFRRLLTNAAPEITGLTGANAAISGLVEDDGSGGELIVTVTVDGTSEELYVLEDDTFEYDLSSHIPPNTTETVTVAITETYLDENTGEESELSTSQTIEVSGVVILPVDFEWIQADGAFVYGEIDQTNVNQTNAVSIMYREVGQTGWNLGTDVISNGTFGFDVAEADGEKDFEFAAMQSGDSVEVFGGSVTFYDLDPGTEGGSGGEEGEGGNSGSGSGGSSSGGENSSGSSGGETGYSYVEEDEDEMDNLFGNGSEWF